MTRAYLSAPAEADVAGIAAYIGANNPVAAEKFVKTVFACLNILSSHPELGRRRNFPNTGKVGLRSWTVPGFRNHVMFYRLRDGNVEVVRVLHGAMDLAVIFGDSTDEKSDE